MKRLFILLPFLSGCVSAGYMEKKVKHEKYLCEEQLVACQSSLENEQRAADSLRQDIREGKYGRKVEPDYNIKWK